MEKEIKKCRCGKASATYKIIGEDLWAVTIRNTEVRDGEYCKMLRCKYCDDDYDTYDPVMVKLFK